MVNIYCHVFTYRLDQDLVPQPHTLPLKERVFAACFTNQEKKILIANENGVINVSYYCYSYASR